MKEGNFFSDTEETRFIVKKNFSFQWWQQPRGSGGQGKGRSFKLSL
jgi:hypothetical protein